MKEETKPRRFSGNNLIWILFLTCVLYFFLASFAQDLAFILLQMLEELLGTSSAVTFINTFYGCTIGAVITVLLVCCLVKKNHFILRSFLPKGMGKDHKIEVVEDTYEASQENTGKNLLIGLLLGFLTNGICIACAFLHGDVKFSSAFSPGIIPILVYAFVMVFIQSSSEELWCRGFLYERICIHYPIWLAVVINGVFFGLLHVFNDGATILAIADIVVCGISYSLVRWYSGSIWMPMGIHAMWNFTQNFIFGLPNSGLVSEVSLFRLDAMNAVSNLIYDYGFGVEGGLPAVLADGLLGIGVLVLAWRSGRLKELRMSYEKKAMGMPIEKRGCDTAEEK